MSAVGDFVKGVSGAAMGLLGTETIAVDGGAAVDAVLNEILTARDYEAGGQAPENTLRAVVKVADWDGAYGSAADAYLGKDVAVRGITMTVGSISKGVSFVELELADEEAAR